MPKTDGSSFQSRTGVTRETKKKKTMMLTSDDSEGSSTAAVTTVLASHKSDSKNRASAVVCSILLQYTITRAYLRPTFRFQRFIEQKTPGGEVYSLPCTAVVVRSYRPAHPYFSGYGVCPLCIDQADNGCLRKARRAVRSSASRMKNELHPGRDRL